MRYLLIILLLMTSCTITLPVHDVPNDIGKACPQGDLECVIDLVDSLADDYECDKFGVMTGYKPANLREMWERGDLYITELYPIWLATGVFGAAYIHPAPYGNIEYCKVWYIQDGMNNSLTHELMHCTGCNETGTMLGLEYMGSGYTDEQLEIMDDEGVKNWYDTSFYQAEDPENHDR